MLELLVVNLKPLVAGEGDLPGMDRSVRQFDVARDGVLPDRGRRPKGLMAGGSSAAKRRPAGTVSAKAAVSRNGRMELGMAVPPQLKAINSRPCYESYLEAWCIGMGGGRDRPRSGQFIGRLRCPIAEQSMSNRKSGSVWPHYGKRCKTIPERGCRLDTSDPLSGQYQHRGNREKKYETDR